MINPVRPNSLPFYNKVLSATAGNCKVAFVVTTPDHLQKNNNRGIQLNNLIQNVKNILFKNKKLLQDDTQKYENYLGVKPDNVIQNATKLLYKHNKALNDKGVFVIRCNFMIENEKIYKDILLFLPGSQASMPRIYNEIDIIFNGRPEKAVYLGSPDHITDILGIKANKRGQNEIDRAVEQFNALNVRELSEILGLRHGKKK